MQPLDLYLAHEKKAEEVATKLCYFYKVSGAVPHQEDAKAEARKALWKRAVSFDPSKQIMQCRAEAENKIRQERQSREILSAAIFGYTPPEYPPYVPRDPYSTFWMFTIMRVRGAVLDFFRAEKLIRKFVAKGDLQRLSKEEIKKIQQRMFDGDDAEDISLEYGIPIGQLDELKPSMFHYAKFLSLSQPMADFSDGSSKVFSFSPNGECLADMLPSREVESVDQKVANLSMVARLKSTSGLTMNERMAVDMFYSEDGYTSAEIGKHIGMTNKEVDSLIASAIVKMRESVKPGFKITLTRSA